MIYVGMYLRRRKYLEEHLVLFMKGFGSNVMSVGTVAEVETALRSI